MKASFTAPARFFLVLSVFFLCCLPSPASSHRSFSTPNVPVDDPVYRQIDKLVAWGLIKDAIYGQRPWSRGEIARMIVDAKRRLESWPAALAPDDRELESRIKVEEILKQLEKDYPRKPSGHPFHFNFIRSVSLDETILNSPSRQVPVDNGVVQVDARVNPLIAYQDGRHYEKGNTVGLETLHDATLTNYFSLSFRPRLEILIPNTGKNDFNFIVQQLYGKFSYRNFSLEVGRDQQIFGQGEFGGHLLSNNARPLDFIKMESEHPFIHPWAFKYLGPSKYTLFIANLGPEREFPYTFMVGWKASAKPTSFFEMGLSTLTFLGGEGAPSLRWYDPILETILIRVGKLSRNVADHRIAFDFRFQIPPLRHSVFYAEAAFEDFWDGINDFVDRSAYLFGLYFPRLERNGKASLRIEYKHSTPIFGRHSTWKSGHTLNQRLLGDELGPDGDMVSVKYLMELSQSSLLGFNFFVEARDSDIIVKINAGLPTVDFRKAVNNPSEFRYRGVVTLDQNFSQHVRARFAFGYERVQQFNFVPGDNRNNFLGHLKMEYLF